MKDEGTDAEKGAARVADDESRGVSFTSIVGSVLAAAFGVQSRRNRERDFAKGNIYAFIVAGVLFTGLFVGAIIVAVKLVLAHAGQGG